MYIYLGDGNVNGAAAYLSGVMLHAGISFDRVDSSASPADDFVSKKYNAYILSDYPRSNFEPGQLEHVRDAVRDGSGLIMLGGWESFHGYLGEYHETVLAEVLPVEMLNEDDRRNYAQPTLIYKRQDHPILAGLPWDHPPFVGGFNEFAAKPNSQTLLSAFCSDVRISKTAPDGSASVPLPDNEFLSFSLTREYPMLVVGTFGKGRTAALATDVAPHWVGGFVDWGKQRVTQKIPGGESIEVGADYARFFSQLVRWTGNEI